MGREVRKVRGDWKHPKDSNGRLLPLHMGYGGAVRDWTKVQSEKGLQAAIEYFGGAPDQTEYMPDWSEAEADHLMMYETTSEGTPISPAFKTPEELARWLADNNASAFGGEGATYEQWLGTIGRGWAPSAVVIGGKMMSGVEAADK